MKAAITQESDYGCGVACFAFACAITYQQAADFLGKEQALSHRFYVNKLVSELKRYGMSYKSKYVRLSSEVTYTEGSIVLLRRSKRYPTGHYLVYHRGRWMDPWINLATSKDVRKAKAGFRARLPGKAMYVIYPEDGII